MCARIPLVLYTRAGCHLCEEMKEVIFRALPRAPFTLEERDIDRDPELASRYGQSIPVLEIAGRVAFKGRMTVEAFERKFARIARELHAER